MEILRQYSPIYLKITVDDQLELKGHILVFLNEKRVECCRGLEINAEIWVSAAAQATVVAVSRTRRTLTTPDSSGGEACA
jgi:Mlc titration factor MtfA (ptsG expression regulator)